MVNDKVELEIELNDTEVVLDEAVDLLERARWQCGDNLFDEISKFIDSREGK